MRRIQILKKLFLTRVGFPPALWTHLKRARMRAEVCHANTTTVHKQFKEGALRLVSQEGVSLTTVYGHLDHKFTIEVI